MLDELLNFFIDHRWSFFILCSSLSFVLIFTGPLIGFTFYFSSMIFLANLENIQNFYRSKE